MLVVVKHHFFAAAAAVTTERYGVDSQCAATYSPSCTCQHAYHWQHPALKIRHCSKVWEICDAISLATHWQGAWNRRYALCQQLLRCCWDACCICQLPMLCLHPHFYTCTQEAWHNTACLAA
jgi:hypothetical protein